MSARTVVARSGTGLGRPVVPDVNCTKATSSSTGTAPGAAAPCTCQLPPVPGVTVPRPPGTRSGVSVTTSAGVTESSTRPSSSAVSRGLIGT